MFYFVYILLSQKDKKYYIGYTNNLERRIKEHQLGEVLSTKWRRPLKLIYYEAFINQKDALRRESYFKTSKGKSGLKIMLREFRKER